MDTAPYQPLPGGAWDNTEPYIFNACAFTAYQLKLAIALKLYVIPKDDSSTIALSDETITEILTDLKDEKLDCANLKAQVEEEFPDIMREVEGEVEGEKEYWGREGDQAYHNWYLKTQAPDYIRAIHATYM